MQNLADIISRILKDGAYKITISNPINKSQQYKKIIAELKKNVFLVSKYTDKQVFHENVSLKEIVLRLSEMTYGHYKQINGISEEKEHIVLISKKGVCTYKTHTLQNTKVEQGFEHNRKKNYILKEGNTIAPLIDMGIFTPDGKIINSMYSKYKQINRFLEIIDDEITNRKLSTLNIIDFGCGKSYLTFILYYYLTEIAGISVNMIGLDLKKDVIEKCNIAAEKYKYDNLKFELGDINGYKAPFEVDMVISLHACDTATDYALYNAVCWNAKFIFSVPCCQHEINEQLSPRKLTLLSRYGIIKERFSALTTDAIRANLLEYCGYKAQLLEFVDLDHTPKNILIRAVKRNKTSAQAKAKMLSEIEELIAEFSLNPTLYELLVNNDKSV